MHAHTLIRHEQAKACASAHASNTHTSTCTKTYTHARVARSSAHDTCAYAQTPEARKARTDIGDKPKGAHMLAPASSTMVNLN